MKSSTNLPEQIRHLRQSRGLSQENMAESLGISTSAYGDLERGKTELSVGRLTSIADLLGITLAQLLGVSEASELTALKETNSRLVRMNIELAFKNELLESRIRTMMASQSERERIGF